jgi:hypothetical protein
MARYFQAPVMQPADYGYEMPFAQKMGYLQKQQQLQDQGRAAVESLYDVGQLNALKQDYAERDKLINARYEETDALMTDENGNLRDFRNIKPAVTSIARRRAKEEQSGGKWAAISNNYAAAQAYQEEIGKMHEKGEIGIKRKDALIADAFAQYTGIGEKDQFGAFNRFSGRTAAKEVDDIQIAYDYAKDVAFQKLQAAGLVTEDGRLLSDEEAAAQMDSPAFKKVLGGDYIQTGSVEYRTMETIKRVTESALYSNNQLKEDILQEAWQNGMDTPELQEAYYDQKINTLAMNAADKYASTKFDPKVMSNWRREKAVDLANAKSAIDYEKQKESHTFEWNTTTDKYTIDKPEELGKSISKGNDRAKFLEGEISRLKGKDNLTAQEQDDIEAYQAELSRVKVQIAGWTEQQKAVGDQIIKKKGAGYGYSKAKKAVIDYFTNNVSGSVSNTTAERKAFEAALDDFFKNSNIPEADIISHMMSGTLWGMDVNGERFADVMMDLRNENGMTFGQPFVSNQVAREDAQKAWVGENVDMSYYFTGDINEINNEGGFEMEQDATAQIADKGPQKFANKALTTMVESGQADLILTNGNGQFDYNSVVKKLKAKSVGKMQAYDLKETHPVTGLPQALIVIEYKDKNNKPRQYKVKVTAPAGSNTVKSMTKIKQQTANQKIENALTRKNDPVAVRDLQEGAMDYGYSKFVGSDIQSVNNLKHGDRPKMVVLPGSEDAPIFFIRTASGHLKAGYGYPDNNGGWITPEFDENQGLIYDVRTWTQKDDGQEYRWDNVETFIQNYGWVAYNVETNRFENPYNR